MKIPHIALLYPLIPFMAKPFETLQRVRVFPIETAKWNSPALPAYSPVNIKTKT
jgi:hypothetical protein